MYSIFANIFEYKYFQKFVADLDLVWYMDQIERKIFTCVYFCVYFFELWKWEHYLQVMIKTNLSFVYFKPTSNIVYNRQAHLLICR